MKIFFANPLLLLLPLLTSCAGTPPASSQTTESQQKLQGQATPVVVEKKSIVPDIDEAGKRGEFARKLMIKSSDLFLKADMNRDYLISAEEARQHLPFVSKDFSRYDKNKDASISWQEYVRHDKWPTPVHGSANP